MILVNCWTYALPWSILYESVFRWALVLGPCLILVEVCSMGYLVYGPCYIISICWGPASGSILGARGLDCRVEKSLRLWLFCFCGLSRGGEALAAEAFIHMKCPDTSGSSTFGLRGSYVQVASGIEGLKGTLSSATAASVPWRRYPGRVVALKPRHDFQAVLVAPVAPNPKLHYILTVYQHA